MNANVPLKCNSINPGHMVFGFGVLKSLGAKPALPVEIEQIAWSAFAVTFDGKTETWFNHHPERFLKLVEQYGAESVRRIAGHYIIIEAGQSRFWFNFSPNAMTPCSAS